MATRLLTEQFAFSGATVRRDGPYPVLEGVPLCGPTSVNRRRYLKAAFAGDRVKRYEGRPVYVDHGRKPGESRGYREQVGWIENPRLRESDGMPVGDIALKPTHADTPSILFDAEHRPANCGMSHVAHCRTTRGADGWEEVDEVVEVESVDIVTDPATTKGLRENRSGAVSITIREFAEQLCRNPKAGTRLIEKAKRLAEMHGDLGGDLGAVAMEPPPEEASPEDGVKEAFKSAILHLVDECLTSGEDPKECLRKIKRLLSAHGEMSGGEAEAEEPEEPEEAEESVKKKPKAADPFALLAECEKQGVRPSTIELKALSLMSAEDRAAWLVEQRKKQPGERPTGATRRPGAGTAGNTTRVEVKAEQRRDEPARLIPAWDE